MKQPSKHDPRSESRLARRLFAAAFMSDTKWRKLIETVGQALPELRDAKVKFIGVDEAKTMRFPPSLNCPNPYFDTLEFGPTELRAIEWLELEADISGLLASVGCFPLTVANGRSRILGYGDSHPDYVN